MQFGCNFLENSSVDFVEIVALSDVSTHCEKENHPIGLQGISFNLIYLLFLPLISILIMFSL